MHRHTCSAILRRLFRSPILLGSLFFLLVLTAWIQLQLSSSSSSSPSKTHVEYLSEDSASGHVALSNSRPHGDTELLLLGTRVTRDLERGTRRCSLLRRPLPSNVRLRNGRWQLEKWKNDRNEIVVYSAFFDDRPLLGLVTWIRVLGVASLPSDYDKLYCHVWYADHVTPYVTSVQLDVTGRRSGYQHNNATYIQYLFSCLLPGVEPVPTHVSVVPSKCYIASTYLPIERPVRAEPDHEFGVCVAISYGTIPVQVFVEWMELHGILGVTEFTVYDSNMTGMADVFEYYAKRREVLRVIPTPPPINNFSVDGIKLGSAAALNDCMMRNVYRYALTVIVDFDEFILPRLHRNYSAMLDDVDRQLNLSERFQGYAFQNAYFFREMESDVDQPAYLRTAVHTLRVEIPKKKKKKFPNIAPKSFVDPRSCLSVFNHYCFIPLMNNIDDIEVPSSIALTHHYRTCGFDPSTCLQFYSSTVEDRTGLRFKDELKPKIEAVLYHLKIV